MRADNARNVTRRYAGPAYDQGYVYIELKWRFLQNFLGSIDGSYSQVQHTLPGGYKQWRSVPKQVPQDYRRQCTYHSVLAYMLNEWARLSAVAFPPLFLLY